MNSKFRRYSLIFTMLLILILSVGVVSAGDTNVSDVQLDNGGSVAEIIVEDISEDSSIEDVNLDNENVTPNIDNVNYLETYNDANFEFNNDSIVFLLNDESQVVPCVNVDLNNMVLPEKYDLRAVVLENGSVVSWVTPVKRQKSSGCCWSFATMAMLESYLLKNWGITYDFSENNLKNIMCNGTPGGSGYGPNNGGNFYLSLAYLLRWSGAVNESDDPYNDSSTVSPSFDPLIHVQGVAYIPLRKNYTDNDQIKAAILKYGALQTSIYWDDVYLNVSAYYYNGPSTSTNHAIAIVGWDDNYSRFNFNNAPPGDGAFIIKNSWGPYLGDGGYYYVSYYDNSFAGFSEGSKISAIAITDVENVTNYDSIYYYDDFGNNGMGAIGYGSDTAWFANQFVSKSVESLAAFGIYTFGPSTFSANISVNNKVVYSQSGSVDYGGYHTIKLNKCIDLNAEDIFKIVIKLTTPNCTYPIAIESNYDKFPAFAKYNQSFISSNGKTWKDLTIDYPLTNVCLKAYTFVKTATSIDMEDISVNVFGNGSYLIKVFDNESNFVDFGNISLYYDNDKIDDFELNNGVFIWNFSDLIGGIHNIKVVYNGNYKYCESQAIKNITVNKLSTDLSVDSITSDVLGSVILIANVNSTHSVDGTVVFYIDDNEVGSADVVNGIAKLNYICQSAGNFTIKAIFNENNMFKSSQNTSNLTINKIFVNMNITQEDVDYKSAFITITLSKPIFGQKITLKFSNGQNATVSTDSKGIATYYVPFNAGSYSVNVSANSDLYDFEPKSLDFEIKKVIYDITPYKLTTTYNSGKYFQVKVVDNKTGKAVSGVKLKLVVYTGSSTKTVYLTTDANGIAKYSGSTLSIATHKVIVSFADSTNIVSKSSTSYLIVKKGTTKVSAPVVKNKYKKNKYFKVTIKNKASGKVIKGLYLKIKVYTGKKYKTYKVKTNSKGIAKINTKALKKGKHKVVIKTTSKYYTVSKSGYLIKIVK